MNATHTPTRPTAHVNRFGLYDLRSVAEKREFYTFKTRVSNLSRANVQAVLSANQATVDGLLNYGTATKETADLLRMVTNRRDFARFVLSFS
jgi:hypothetical protein